MLDPEQPFMESVRVTQPYLVARSVGGSLMTLGHAVFVVHAALVLGGRSAPSARPTLFRPLEESA